MKENLKIRVAIHLSSTAVYTVAGYPNHNGKQLKILAVGVAKTEGFFGGYVTNPEAFIQCIKNSVEQVMDMGDLEIYHVGLSFSTPSMASSNGVKTSRLTNNASAHSLGKTLEYDDIVNIFDKVKEEVVERRYETTQICTQVFAVDADRMSKPQHSVNPVGMYAYGVAVAYHLIAVPRSYHQQLNDIFEKSSLGIYPAVFAGVSGAEYALSDDEKEQGVCFVDIGAGTTNVCVYLQNELVFSHCFEMAGHMVDQDIVQEFQWANVSIEEAKYLKENHGSAYASDKSKKDFQTVKKNTKNDGITITPYSLASVIEDRYYAIFEKIIQSLDEEGLLGGLKAGMVLAGGGAKIKDLERMIKKRFNVSVRQINVNNCVSVCAKHVNDDNMKLINGYLADNTLHNAIGVLLHQQSKQYIQDERFLYSQENPSRGWFGRVKQVIHHWASWGRRWL